MTPLDLQESSSPERHQMPPEVAAVMNQLGIATVTPINSSDWLVANIRKVGVIQVADYQITIRPKIPVDRLFFLMAYSLDREFWRDEDITISSDNHADLLSTIATAFLRHTTRATRQGILQGYKVHEEALPMVRGRIDIPAQIGRRAGLPFPAQVIFDEYTTDIAENRILLSAARRLLSLPSLTDQFRADLKKTTRSLNEVTPLASAQPLPQIHFTRLNARYRPALVLARIILQNSSIQQASGDIAATAFLFDMWRIFEDFVSTTLAECLENHGGTTTPQARGKHLDEGSQIALRPDLLWQDGTRCKAVIDAKYKKTKLASYPNADIYQMLAYCVRFGLESGHLIYAKGEGESEIHTILGHTAFIHCHTVDLNTPPTVLLAQMSHLAEEIVDQEKREPRPAEITNSAPIRPLMRR